MLLRVHAYFGPAHGENAVGQFSASRAFHEEEKLANDRMPHFAAVTHGLGKSDPSQNDSRRIDSTSVYKDDIVTSKHAHMHKLHDV